MNKRILLIVAILLLSPGVCFAVSSNARAVSNNNANNQATAVAPDTEGSGVAASSQANFDDETLQTVGTATSSVATGTVATPSVKIKSKYEPKNARALERRSAVANAAQELVRSADRIEDRGIGDKIRLIAQAQNDDQDKINESIDKADNRTKTAKFFIGPNYKELKEAKRLMKDNIAEIKDLKASLDNISNDTEKAAILAQIVALHEKNIELRDQIEAMDDGFSLFGWLNKWIAKY